MTPRLPVRRNGAAAVAAVVAVTATLALSAAPRPAPPPAAAHLVPGYDVPLLPANLAPTTATVHLSGVEVIGQPRQSTGHPCTLWDQADLDQLKRRLPGDAALQSALATLRKSGDQRLAQPLGVPAADGSLPTRDTYRIHEANARSISELGTLYALTGEAAYGEYCRALLLAYARNYAAYRHPEGWTVQRYRSAQDGRLTGQFLEDGFWLVHAGWGYDLVYNLPSWTDADRHAIRSDLLEAIAAEFYAPILGQTDYLNGTHNRAAICTSGVLLAGYASDNDRLVQLALYGQGGSAQAPKGGVFGTHFTTQCILPDGLWVEGAPAYQVGIASCGLFNDAEILWHHGLDLYRFRDGALKSLLDSALALAYPDARRTVAALHDSSRMALLDDRDWLNQQIGLPYECGYRRYQDPHYLPIVRHATQSLSLTVHAGAPSLFLELPPGGADPAPSVESANYFATGYGVLRLNPPAGPTQLILEFGPSAGHAHPSKLGLDLFAQNECWMPFPGVIFPYGHALNTSWYWTTLANCALTVDEQPQLYSKNRWQHPRSLPEPVAQQVIFAPATRMGLERASSTSIYPGVIQDRALFLTEDYLADLFLAADNSPHTYDLAWHVRGHLSTPLPLQPMKFSAPVSEGYNALTDTRHCVTAEAWSAAFTRANGPTLRLFSAGGTSTEIIAGDGHFFTSKASDDEHPPTLIQRRSRSKETLFGTVADISAATPGYVLAVGQTGGIPEGYGLLKIQTVRGTDLCFSAYRKASYKTPDLETDALQALALFDGTEPRALYLAGGTTLRVAATVLTRSESGLACFERLADGTCVLANPSSTAATVTLQLSPTAQATAASHPLRTIDGDPLSVQNGIIRALLPPGSTVKWISR